MAEVTIALPPGLELPANGRLREPGVVVIQGHPTPAEVSDDAAAFCLRRETWDLPVVARFTIDGEPASKARARFTKVGSKTQAYTPGKTKDAEDVVAWKFRQCAPAYRLTADMAYGVMAIFFCGTRQRRDVDNMLKLILDGLNGVAWADDSQVSEVSARKTLTLPPDARTEVVVYQVGPVQRLTLRCEQCGTDFPVFNSVKADRRYCSPECASAARVKAVADKKCPQCGKSFPPKVRRQVYCSTACGIAGSRPKQPGSHCTECGKELAHRRGGRCRDCWRANPGAYARNKAAT